MIRKTINIKRNVLGGMLADESGASKMYMKMGKKWHDPTLERMSRDEMRHYRYWKKVQKAKNRPGLIKL